MFACMHDSCFARVNLVSLGRLDTIYGLSTNISLSDVTTYGHDVDFLS
jgi:hypothetical protein